MEQEINQAQQYLTVPSFKIGSGSIDISLGPNSIYLWKWAWSNKALKKVLDIDVYGNAVWYIETDEEANNNKLICETSDGKILWSKKKVSWQVAVIGELCYYIKISDYFRTIELCVCNAYTGNNEQILYKEPDRRRELTLHKCSNRTLYLVSDDTVNSKLYRVIISSSNSYSRNHTSHEIQPLARNSLLQWPLGESIYGDDCILVRKSRYMPWIAVGKPINEWIFPDEEIEWANIQTGNIVTICEGAKSIWFCAPKKKPRLILKIKIGNIEPNVWTSWENSSVHDFIIKSPFEIPFLVHLTNNKLMRSQRSIHIEHHIKFNPLDVHRYHTLSKDGTRVPFIVIKEKGIKPKAQLIYVYGAYGSSTQIGWPYNKWYPILKRKWAIVYALVRGGGDVDAGWAEDARRENRHLSVDDFEATIKAAKIKNELSADKTVIYGRSAGGLPIGALVSRFPDGTMVGAAFTEVPYVDVLRTSSNPDLPLTVGEYGEFGNPNKRIVNFKELLSVSPINTLPADGAPGVFVISRVGLLDKQVFAYESFKWIQRLRGTGDNGENISDNPKGKYVTFEREEGHYYNPKRFPRFRGIDLAILDGWIEGKLEL
jgi:protease II